ncbi:tRNA pseudouridine synthase B [Cryobacterium psychrotolerans]|uniref:tRNA pseudouridine synthase B n=1 Tax=Cryobacterium psychrotolerans TaxID=386301 RepID=A0A1G8YQW7_9MICO|nr:tRNA pseudouridine(55) synthase TruB [Cryobacterium psychrotolerans]TFD85636.1 tRNA pseudouridine(55) synthase TruB [Cryobacterium psychrotolerans]SDK05252.1 tRNA pseudouridine synthase B [Cryobacterium psychrotolerans]
MTSGLLLIDKPQGWTSHDAVARTRRLAGTRKVGHAGTLDPMATGLLILGVDSSTRLLTYIVGLDKEYLATIRLGASTTTDDAEGEQLVRAPAETVAAIRPGAVEAGIATLTGFISQQPSAVSAIKVDGKRAYARVRDGEDVELPARPVTVSVFELLSSTAVDGFLDLEVRVVCSSGTYIRALARDLGAALGVGGHLTSLRRTRIGPFRLEAAQPLDELDVASALIGPADAATRLLGRLDLSEQQAIDLGHGKRITVDPAGSQAGPIAAIAPDGRLIGLVEYRGDQAKSLINFPPDEAAPDEAAPDEAALSDQADVT